MSRNNVYSFFLSLSLSISSFIFFVMICVQKNETCYFMPRQMANFIRSNDSSLLDLFKIYFTVANEVSKNERKKKK